MEISTWLGGLTFSSALSASLDKLSFRPIKDLVDGLQQMNVEIECETGCPPLMVRSNELAGGEVSM